MREVQTTIDCSSCADLFWIWYLVFYSGWIRSHGQFCVVQRRKSAVAWTWAPDMLPHLESRPGKLLGPTKLLMLKLFLRSSTCSAALPRELPVAPGNPKSYRPKPLMLNLYWVYSKVHLPQRFGTSGCPSTPQSPPRNWHFWVALKTSFLKSSELMLNFNLKSEKI